MRGLPDYNFPVFHKATDALRRQGHEVWSPAEHDEREGFDPKTDEAMPLRHYMKTDLTRVCESDAIAVLDGWEDSVGAALEVHVARTCDIPVYQVSVADLELNGHDQTIAHLTILREPDPEPWDEFDVAITDTGKAAIGDFGMEFDKAEHFDTGAIRSDATGKGRYDLLSPAAIRRVALVYEKGAAQKGDRNWENGIPDSRLYSSALRHIFQSMEGRRDEDHVAHAAWNLLAILHFDSQRTEEVNAS